MTLTERIEAALGARIVASSSMPVGFGLQGLVATLSDGRRIAAKASPPDAPQAENLVLEGWMLAELRRLSALPIPEVHAAEPGLLVMSFIANDGGVIDAGAERHAAELLAELHATRRPHFGLSRDTLIGPLEQPNPRSESWVSFFRDHRLVAPARAAHDEGRLPGALLARIENLAVRIGDHLGEPDHAALLHGDLWTGNVLVRGGRIAGFVDPAIYFGHPEIELAFTTMFGTFGAAFFDAYEALSPLQPGFHENRKDIYNLYPTIVHVRLFGSGYLPPIDRTLSRLGV
jgi:fructosamine-3-kinase